MRAAEAFFHVRGQARDQRVIADARHIGFQLVQLFANRLNARLGSFAASAVQSQQKDRVGPDFGIGVLDERQQFLRRQEAVNLGQLHRPVT